MGMFGSHTSCPDDADSQGNMAPLHRQDTIPITYHLTIRA
jgi:hypothetical protein